MTLKVDPQPIGSKLHRLSITHNGKFIGEYERSQTADIARKTEEIRCALPALLDIFERKGEFEVRWDTKRRVKSIRVNQLEVGKIPVECWRKPSWES